MLFRSYGYNVKILFDDNLILWCFDSNKKCIPYKSLNAVNVVKGKINSVDDVVKIGSFSLLIKMNLVVAIHYKLIKDKNMKNFYECLVTSLFKLRSTFLEKNKLTIMDKTVFDEVVLSCIGVQIDPQREYWKNVEKKIKENIVFFPNIFTKIQELPAASPWTPTRILPLNHSLIPAPRNTPTS